MKKSELIKYLNDNTIGRKAGRKEFRINDIFISSSEDALNFRLSAFGRNIVEKHFKSYTIQLVSKHKSETGYELINLDRYMISPYFLHKNKLVVFEESIAAEFLLLEGDFSLWVKNKEFQQ